MKAYKTFLLLLLFIVSVGMICSMFVSEEYSKWINRAVCLIIVFVMFIIIQMKKNK